MMISVLRIIVAVLIFAGGTLGVSVLWPKITPEKPPKPIEQIREIIGETTIGEKIVGEEKGLSTPTPITTETVEEKITKIVTEKVTEKTTQELEKTLKAFTPEQLEAVRKIICKPE